MKRIHVTSWYSYAFTAHAIMVLKGILLYIQRICLKNNTQILNKPLGSISNLKDPQSRACERHFFLSFSFILTTEIFFFLPFTAATAVASKAAQFIKETNLCAMST